MSHLYLIYLLFHSESLIRTAFQCLQLVVTDFLPTMPCMCLQIVVDVASSFGLQNQELNISLTSIGLLVRSTANVACKDSLALPWRCWVFLWDSWVDLSGWPRVSFFPCSGTSQTTSSKGEKQLLRSWRGRKRFSWNKPKIKVNLWTDPSTLRHPLTACGCACMPSWVSCAWTHGRLWGKVPARQCSPPLLLTERCCNHRPGTSWFGRY